MTKKSKRRLTFEGHEHGQPEPVRKIGSLLGTREGRLARSRIAWDMKCPNYSLRPHPELVACIRLLFCENPLLYLFPF